MTPDDWRVLLIAGASGTGKTTAALEIGRRLGVSVLQADELRLALQRVTTGTSHAALHRFLDAGADVWSDADEYASGLREVAEIVSRAVEPVIEHRTGLPEVGRLVIEGDGLLPSLIAHREGVRAVVVVDGDPATLRERLAERDRGFSTLPTSAQEVSIRGNVLFGEFLAEAAEQWGVPVIEAAPVIGLADRILSAVGADD